MKCLIYLFIIRTVVLFSAGGNEGDDEESSDESGSSEEGEGGAGAAGVKPGADTGSDATPAAPTATTDSKASAASAQVVQASGDGESQPSAEKPATISPRPPDVNHSASNTVAAREGGGNHVKPATAEVVGNNSPATGNSQP
jgi:hypothetical protein